MAEGSDDGYPRGRGLVLTQEFCEATGWERTTVDALIVSGRLAGTVHEDDTAHGVWEDALPSRAELEAMGPPVDAAYDPATLAHDVPGPDDSSDAWPDDGTTGAEWTMTWGDQPDG